MPWRAYQAVADGETYAAIASQRGTSTQVIKNTMCRLSREFDCSSGLHTVVSALRRGLID